MLKFLVHSMIKYYFIFVENLDCYAMEAENPRPGHRSDMEGPNDLKAKKSSTQRGQKNVLISKKKRVRGLIYATLFSSFPDPMALLCFEWIVLAHCMPKKYLPFFILLILY